MVKKVKLKKYDNSWYNPGNSTKRFLWYYVNELVLKGYHLFHFPF